MRAEYKGWVIDPTPDEYLGKYFARARITCGHAESANEPEMHIERDIAWFEFEDQAIECGCRWAFRWIDSRVGGPDFVHNDSSILPDISRS
jgi:hypothetical protein